MTSARDLDRRQFLQRCGYWSGSLLLLPLAAACGAVAPPSTPPATGGTKARGSARGTTPAPPRPAVQSAYSAVSGSMWPAYVAADLGLFEKYGLDVALKLVRSTVTLTPAMVAGQIPIAVTGGGDAINADIGGAELVLVAGLVQRFVFYIYADRSIRSVADLRGKTLAVSKLGSATDVAGRLALEHFGLHPPQDVAIVAAGGLPEQLAALQAGGVQAAVLSPPTNVRAAEAGFHLLVDIAALDIPYLQSAVVTTRSFLQAQRDEALAYLKATVEAISVIKRDPVTAKRVLGKYSHTTSAKALDASYRAFAPLFSLDATVSTPAVETALRGNPQGRGRAPAGFVDDTLMAELQSSGFLRSFGA